jgi:outer membrane protein assembly factor BamA
LLVLLLLFFSGCASVPADERVDEVELAGAAGLDPDDVLAGLTHHPPDGWIFVDYAAYEPLAIGLDRRRIESYYRRRGYFSARVTNVEIDDSGEGYSVRFLVDEGEPSLLTDVALEGAPPEQEAPLRALVAELSIGQPFEYGPYEEVKAKLRKALVAKGFVHAKVEGRVEVDRDRHHARARYLVNAGPVVRIGTVTVEGLELLPKEFVLDRMAIAEDDRFDPSRLDTTRGRILSTGLVESVRFGWDRQKEGETLDLVVGIAEGPRNELRFGVGAARSNGYQLRLLGSYARKSLFDPLLTFRFTLRPSWDFLPNTAITGRPSIEARAELERQDVLWPRLVGTLGVEYRFVQLEAYTTNGPTLSFGLGRPFLDDRLRAAIRVQYDHFSIDSRFDPKEVGAGELASAGILSPLRSLIFAPALTYDGRDDPIDPRFGWFAELRLEVGQTFGFGAHATVTPDLRGYVPLFWERLVLAGRARFGATIFADATLPITRRYFSGGPESQRGFGRRRLAPFLGEVEPLPVGGEALFETSAELRLDLFQLFGQWFGVVGFVDGADATRTIEELDLLNLHWAAGGGLRYRTPIGAIRIDAGFRLNRRGAGEPDAGELWALHFSLGEAF